MMMLFGGMVAQRCGICWYIERWVEGIRVDVLDGRYGIGSEGLVADTLAEIATTRMHVQERNVLTERHG